MNILRLFKRIYFRLRYATIRVGATSEETDNWFRQQLKDPVFTDFEKHTVNLNGITIWISNSYYGAPSICQISELPYMDTTVQFYELYRKALYANLTTKDSICVN